jgi:hypothetical protein
MKFLRSIAMTAIALAVLGSGAANASDTTSSSQVNPVGGSSLSEDGTTSSSVTLDANNFAKSFVTPGTSIMGAAVSADPSVSFSPSTQTTHNDDWFFNCNATHVCGSVPISQPIPIQLTFGVKVSETQVTGGDAFLEFDANYQLQTGGSFSFSFAQDGPGDFELSSQYFDASGKRTDLPVVTTLSDGVYTLSVNATVDDSVCGLNSVCIPEEMSCPAGESCSSTPAFTDQQFIRALIDSNADAGPDMIDGFDPFSIDIVSLDPNYQFISADGRTIGNLPAGGVPEPAAWAMMLTGFAGIGWTLRRRRTSAAPAG